MYPVRIGTCGWSYKEWSGDFYPDGLGAGEVRPAARRQRRLPGRGVRGDGLG